MRNDKPSSVEVPMKKLKYKMNNEKQAFSPSATGKQATIHWAPARLDGDSNIYWYDVNNPKNVTWNNPMPGKTPPENTIAVRNALATPARVLGPTGGGGGGSLLKSWVDIMYPPSPPPRPQPDVIHTNNKWFDYEWEKFKKLHPDLVHGATHEIGPDGTEVPKYMESHEDIPWPYTPEHHKPWVYDPKKDPDAECSLSGGHECTIS